MYALVSLPAGASSSRSSLHRSDINLSHRTVPVHPEGRGEGDVVVGWVCRIHFTNVPRLKARQETTKVDPARKSARFRPDEKF